MIGGRARAALEAAVLGGAFAVAYGQAPLYTENQNAYMLRGLARAGVGALSRDWTAQTVDSFPLFTWLVTVVARTGHVSLFHGIYAGVLALYAIAMVGVVSAVFHLDRRQSQLVWIGVTALHAAAVLSAARVVGLDTLLMALLGDLGFHLLGPGLQPSVCASFLIASAWAYARGRPWLAVCLSSAVATLHSNFLLSAATLTVAYMAGLTMEGKRGRALWVGLTSLVTVLPAVAFTAARFYPTSPDVFRAATHVLNDGLLYSEMHVSGWFGPAAIGQLTAIVAAIVVLRGHRMFPVLLAPLVVGGLLTATHLVTGSHTIGLLEPWRMSVWVAPLATCVLIGRAAVWASARRSLDGADARRWVGRAVVAVMAGCAAGGVVVSVHRVRYAQSLNDVGVLTFVRTHRTATDLYLIPTAFQRFRLSTGAPALADSKTHPFKDVEVVEWDARMQAAESVYVAGASDVCERLARVRERYGITHVVVPQDRAVSCEGVDTVFSDRHFRLLRFAPIG